MRRRGFVRRVVLPSLWLVIGLAIAASLVKLAFVDSAVGLADDSLQPTGQAPSDTVPVERGTVHNSLTVDGTIELDPSWSVLSTADGEFSYTFVEEGAFVEEGQRLFQVRTETMPEEVEVPAAPEPAEGEQQGEGEEPAAEPPAPAPAPEPIVRFHDVYAPVSGRLSGFAVELSDPVAEDAVMATVQPQTFKAVGSITPLDRYRLMDGPRKATVTIKGGPAPFPCRGLAIGDSATAAPAASPEEGGDPGGGDAATRITCRVPGDVTVFDGLSMSMEIAAGSAKGVLVVPVTAVRGLLGTGSIWVMGPDGLQTERQVELGVTDGKVIEVTSGLEAGDTVLRYVPGSGGREDEEMMGDPMMGEVCC